MRPVFDTTNTIRRRHTKQSDHSTTLKAIWSKH